MVGTNVLAFDYSIVISDERRGLCNSMGYTLPKIVLFFFFFAKDKKENLKYLSTTIFLTQCEEILLSSEFMC